MTTETNKILQKTCKDYMKFKKRITITTNISSDYKKTKQLHRDTKDYKEKKKTTKRQEKATERQNCPKETEHDYRDLKILQKTPNNYKDT